MLLLLQVNPMHMPWAVPSLYGVEDTVASGERPAAQRLATYRLVRPVFDSCGRSTYTMVHPNLCPVYLMYVLYIYIHIFIYTHIYRYIYTCSHIYTYIYDHICIHVTSVIWMMNITQHGDFGTPKAPRVPVASQVAQCRLRTRTCRKEPRCQLCSGGEPAARAAGSGWRSEMFCFFFGRCLENLGTFL